MITHNLAVVRHVSDEAVIMYMGRFVETGPTRQVFASPAHPYSAALIAAQPQPDPARRRRGAILLGEVSSLRNRPPGCEFHPRCPKAGPVCAAAAPAPSPAHGEGSVRCHYPLTAGAPH
jgi:peptide/nickel transport system ATP-binding protein